MEQMRLEEKKLAFTAQLRELDAAYLKEQKGFKITPSVQQPPDSTIDPPPSFQADFQAQGPIASPRPSVSVGTSLSRNFTQPIVPSRTLPAQNAPDLRRPPMSFTGVYSGACPPPYRSALPLPTPNNPQMWPQSFNSHNTLNMEPQFLATGSIPIPHQDFHLPIMQSADMWTDPLTQTPSPMPAAPRPEFREAFFPREQSPPPRATSMPFNFSSGAEHPQVIGHNVYANPPPPPIRDADEFPVWNTPLQYARNASPETYQNMPMTVCSRNQSQSMQPASSSFNISSGSAPLPPMIPPFVPNTLPPPFQNIQQPSALPISQQMYPNMAMTNYPTNQPPPFQANNAFNFNPESASHGFMAASYIPWPQPPPLGNPSLPHIPNLQMASQATSDALFPNTQQPPSRSAPQPCITSSLPAPVAPSGRPSYSKPQGPPLQNAGPPFIPNTQRAVGQVSTPDTRLVPLGPGAQPTHPNPQVQPGQDSNVPYLPNTHAAIYEALAQQSDPTPQAPPPQIAGQLSTIGANNQGSDFTSSSHSAATMQSYPNMLPSQIPVSRQRLKSLNPFSHPAGIMHLSITRLKDC